MSRSPGRGLVLAACAIAGVSIVGMLVLAARLGGDAADPGPIRVVAEDTVITVPVPGRAPTPRRAADDGAGVARSAGPTSSGAVAVPTAPSPRIGPTRPQDGPRARPPAVPRPARPGRTRSTPRLVPVVGPIGAPAAPRPGGAAIIPGAPGGPPTVTPVSAPIAPAIDDPRPVSAPPVIVPPGTGPPPVVTPPGTEPPPVVTPPGTETPPVVTPPDKGPPPVVTPPDEEPPPVVTPPDKEPPPVVTPPDEEPPPVVTPPDKEPPPVVTPPVTDGKPGPAPGGKPGSAPGGTPPVRGAPAAAAPGGCAAP